MLPKTSIANLMVHQDHSMIIQFEDYCLLVVANQMNLNRTMECPEEWKSNGN